MTGVKSYPFRQVKGTSSISEDDRLISRQLISKLINRTYLWCGVGIFSDGCLPGSSSVDMPQFSLLNIRDEKGRKKKKKRKSSARKICIAMKELLCRCLRCFTLIFPCIPFCISACITQSLRTLSFDISFAQFHCLFFWDSTSPQVNLRPFIFMAVLLLRLHLAFAYIWSKCCT